MSQSDIMHKYQPIKTNQMQFQLLHVLQNLHIIMKQFCVVLKVTRNQTN